MPEPARPDVPQIPDGLAPVALGVPVPAGVRAEWRADEMEWTREAARRWLHARCIGDVLREHAARGDRLAIDVGGRTFEGVVGSVGEDCVGLVTPTGAVTIRTALPPSSGALPAPVVIRRSARARAGGWRLPATPTGFTARLRELEMGAGRVRLGTFTAAPELTGTVVVGVDHAVVRGDDDVTVPLAWLAYVAPASEAGS